MVLAKASELKCAPDKAPRRSLNVECAANQLDVAVADMREAMEALEEQLQPIMSPAMPIAMAEERPLGASDFAERIISSADRVREASARIRELIDRL